MLCGSLPCNRTEPSLLRAAPATESGETIPTRPQAHSKACKRDNTGGTWLDCLRRFFKDLSACLEQLSLDQRSPHQVMPMRVKPEPNRTPL